MLGQKVACRGTACIGRFLQESAVLKLFYDLVSLDDFWVCGTIVSNKNLIAKRLGNIKALCMELFDHLNADAVVARNQYG